MRRMLALLWAGLLVVLGTGPAPSAAAVPAPASLATGAYVPLAPLRVLDTRVGSVTTDGQYQAQGPIPSGVTRNVLVAGRAGVPASGVSAVVLNLTGVAPTGSGYLTLFPTGAARPGTSNLNLRAGETAANLVVVKLGSSGQVSYFNGGPSVEVVADVAGYYPVGGSFTAMNPARVLDTRNGGATVDGQYSGTGEYGPGTTRTVRLTGRAGVPTTGVAAVVLNLTAVSPTSATYVTTFPAGAPRPSASNLNLGPGQVRANLVVARPGTNGDLAIFNSAGSAHMLADVVGWIPTGTTYTSLVPSRLLDSRSGAPLAAGESRDLEVTGAGGVPAGGVSAVILNVTAVAPTAPSTYVTVHPSDMVRPNASNLNLLKADTRPNLVIVKVSPTGQVRLFNAHGSTHLLVDVAGWFGSATPPVITTTSLPQGTIGALYTAALVATGAAPFAWTRTAGSLPAGLALSGDGRVTGTPTTAGSSSFTVGATDASGQTDTQSLTIIVSAALSITTAALPQGKVDVAYSAQLTTSGGAGAVSYAVTSGSLPAGLALDTTGELSGRPTVQGTSTFTARATDAAGRVATRQLSLVVVQFRITTTLPNPTQDLPYSVRLATADARAPVTWTVESGSLPPGLTLSDTGLLSGTATETGTSTFVVAALDADGLAARRSYTLAVSESVSPVIVTDDLPSAQVGVGYLGPVSAVGGSGSRTWTVAAGALPAGLTLSTTTGMVEGRPTATGSATFTLRVTDGAGTDTQAFVLDVRAIANWPQPGQDGSLGSRSSDPTFTPGNAGDLQTRWQLPGGPSVSPAVVDGVLYSIDLRLGHDEADLVAYDVVTGDIQWWLPAPGCAELAVTSTTIVAACTGGLRAWSRTGNRQLLWDTASTDPGRNPERVRVVGTTALVCDGGVRAYSLTTGARLWQVFLPSGTSCRSMAVSGDTVVVPTSADLVRAYALTGGSLRWSHPGTSALVQGTTAVITTSTTVVARQLSDGVQTWSTAVTDPSTVLAAGIDTVYVGTFTIMGEGSWGSTVVALNSATGARRWAVDTPSNPTGGAVSGGVLWVAWASMPADGRYGGIRSLDAATGAHVGDFRDDGRQVFDPVVVGGGHVIAQRRVLGLAPSAPRISTRYLTPGRTGAAYQRILEAGGGNGDLAWSRVGGVLPAGVNLTAGGSLTGTPTTAGVFTVTLRASDRRGLSATVTYAIRIVAAGSSDWTTAGGDSRRSGVNGEESVLGVDTMPSMSRAWSAAPVTAPGRSVGPVLGAAVIIDDRVYVAYGNGIVAAFARSGSGAKTPLWSATADAGVTFVSGLTAAGGVGYVVGSDGELYALRLSSGARVWRTTTTPSVGLGPQPSPLVVNGVVYWVRSLVHATRTTDGAPAWASPYDPYLPGDSTISEPLTSDGTRIFVAGACVVSGVNASTGAQAWRRDYWVRSGPTPWCNQSVERWGPPTVVDGTVHFSDFSRTYVLDAVTGADAGTALRARGGTTSPSPGVAVLALGLPQMFGGYYYTPALTDLRTGEVLWRPGTDLVDTRPVVAGGVVFVRSGQQILGLDLATGDTVWRDTVGGQAHFGSFDSIAVGRGSVVVGSTDGTVVAFSPA